MHPNTGPTAGGTLVEVMGAGIEVPDARGLWCQFGAAEPVAATHASRELVLCVVPPSEGGAIGAVPVRLLNNDAVYGSVVAFTYRALPSVHRLHPVAGMRGGGTLVTVYGSGFIGDMATVCRFGDVAVPARVLAVGQLECTSPVPAVVGYVAVEVSQGEPRQRWPAAYLSGAAGTELSRVEVEGASRQSKIARSRSMRVFSSSRP